MGNKNLGLGRLYVTRYDIYTGATESGVEHGLGYNVVMSLMDPYLDKGYHLFVDNFYTSPYLFTSLEQRATYACGTVRSNR